MYPLLLSLHSLLRWAVVALFVWALLDAINGLRTPKPYGPKGPRSGFLLTMVVDTQLLVGLLLYGVFSPVTALARANMRVAMHDHELRFWAVEHLAGMLLAVLALHVGRVLARKGPDDRARHRRLAVSLALFGLLVLAAVPWPFMPVARPLFRFGL